eukprot:365466-Chlamydomonas_euryale.AAC.12
MPIQSKLLITWCACVTVTAGPRSKTSTGSCGNIMNETGLQGSAALRAVSHKKRQRGVDRHGAMPLKWSPLHHMTFQTGSPPRTPFGRGRKGAHPAIHGSTPSTRQTRGTFSCPGTHSGRT